ncbi:MAG: CRISPR-associated endonuclease Cas2 [Candidatus Methanomethylicaceae archaeon]
MVGLYVIMVYDVGAERVARVLKVARCYLHWVQNSVLEGELTPGNFERLKAEVSDVIDQEKDSVTFYILRTTKYLTKVTIGTVKGVPEIFL